MKLSCLHCIPVLLCLAAAAAQTPSVRFDPGVHPFEPHPMQLADGTWIACRVVDGLSGRPIAGAELFLVAESNTPVAGRFTFLRKVASDANGFAALPLGEHKGGWLILRARGYGPASDMDNAPSRVWALQPALDVPVQLRDWLDRPVPGASVGVCLGCGHTPDVTNATADANGIALVRGVDPDNGIADFYPQHPDLGIDHYDGVDWVPGDPPAFVRASYGEPVRGTLLDPDGKPVAGAFVGTKQKHRGPWTSTRADGTFQLDGAEPDSDLFVVLAGRPDHEYQFECPWQQPYTLGLPVADDEPCQLIDLPRPAGEKGLLRLQLDDAEGKPLPGLSLSYVGPLPMRHQHRDQTGGDGSTGFELVAGVYEVRCHDARHQRSVGTIAVAAGKTAAQTLRPTPLPTVRLQVPDGCRVHLMRAGHSTEITGPVADGEPIPVPTGETFGIDIDRDGDQRTFALTAGPALAQQPLRLDFLPPTRVTAQCIDASGQPVAVRCQLLSRYQWRHGDERLDLLRFEGSAAADGRIQLDSRGAGLHLLAVRPEAGDLQPLLLPVSLPHRGADARVDLGRITLPSAPRLTILTAAGKPYAGPPPGWLRLGWQDVRDPPRGVDLDAAGNWLGVDPRAGDAIVVPAARWDLEAEPDADGLPTVLVPFRTVLQGDGPWRLAVPAGELLLQVRDANGKPLPARAFVADRSIELDGRVLLRQLPPGPLAIVVAAEGTQTAYATVQVPASGRGELDLALPPR